jgi:Spy/CpxP family protein refolding chaperone
MALPVGVGGTTYWRGIAMYGIRKLAAALLALAVSWPLLAEEAPAPGLDQATAKFERERRSLIADNMSFTPAEAARFWPIYQQFQKDLFGLIERRRALIAEFGENYDAMTDAKAKQILRDHIGLEEDRFRLMRAYAPRFEPALSAKKLARYYQIENKIHHAAEAGIAEEIPLIK